MANVIKKAYEITDAKISFVSLVGKAANRHQFIITKSQDGTASFQTYGRILKAAHETHLVTGIVYEPMTEDTDGNYMTEEEITKAAHWFMKNSGDVDIQHCFTKAEGVEVVESSVALCDMEIEGEPIKKGTWLVTMEVSDTDVWDKIEKGEITGFSMGGVGVYSTEDVDIDEPVEKQEKRSILKGLAKLLGLSDAEPVSKGAVKDSYSQRVKSDNFWSAFYSLQDALCRYDYNAGHTVWCGDRDQIMEALAEFNEIVADLLSEPEDLWKAVKEQPVEKAGKTLSTKNLEALKSIHESLGAFLASNNPEKEENEVTKEQAQSIAAEAAAAAIEKAFGGLEEPTTPAQGTAPAGNVEKGNTEITQESIEEMVAKAVAKAMGEEEPPAEPETPTIGEMVEKAVAKALQPYLEQEGTPAQLNGEGVTKAEDEVHYLHGIL